MLRLQVQHPDFCVAAACRHKGKLPPVRRQRRLIVESGIRGEPLQLRSIAVGPIDVRRPIPHRSKDDPGAVTRERRVPLQRRVGEEDLGVAPIRIGQKYLGVHRREAGVRNGVCRLRLCLLHGNQKHERDCAHELFSHTPPDRCVSLAVSGSLWRKELSQTCGDCEHEADQHELCDNDAPKPLNRARLSCGQRRPEP